MTKTLDIYNIRNGGRTFEYDVAIHTHASAKAPKFLSRMGFAFRTRSEAVAKQAELAPLLDLPVGGSCNR